MKKLSKPALVLWALVIGMGGGYLLGWHFRSRFADEAERRLEISIHEDKGDAVLRALKHLRADSTNTVPFLESQLDDVVLGLGPLSAESQSLMLGKIRDYRSSFPHTSSQPGHDKRIAEILTKSDEKH